MPNYVVFRTQKLKSWGEVGAAGSHNLRTRPTPNAGGPGGFVEVVPTAGRMVDAVREKIGDQTIRSNAVLAVEVVISASPEYFRPDAPERAGHWQEDRLKAWRDAVEPWIAERFPHAASVVLHLDEATPHYQIIDVPLDEKGKLNCRAKYGGGENLVQWQTDAAKPVAHLGIERGIEGSLAKHVRIKQFYAAANAPVPPVPKVTTPKPEPLPPRTLAQSMPLSEAKKEPGQLEQQRKEQAGQRRLEVKERQAAIVDAWPVVSQKAKATELAERQAKDAKATAAAAAAKAASLRADADRLRALSVDEVLRRVYGAELERGSRDAHASRKFRLPDGRKVAVSQGRDGSDVWIEQGDKGQRGAINLVMHLDGLQYKDAVRLLAEHFEPGALATEHARTLVDRARVEVQQISQEPVAAPAPDPTKWPRVRKWLKEVRGMPLKLVDMLHSQGLLYADSRANATFLRVNGGAFQRGTGDTPFHRTIGLANCGPFIIPGKGKKVVVVEAPMDAVAIKATDAGATVIASGGDLLPPKDLARWIPEGAEVQAGHDADKRGDQLAKAAKLHLQAERLRPEHKDWAETVKTEPWRVDPAWTGGTATEAPKVAPRPDFGPSWSLPEALPSFPTGQSNA